MNKLLMNFMKDETGATLIEYALLATLIAVAAIVAMSTLGKDISNQFVTIGNSISR